MRSASGPHHVQGLRLDGRGRGIELRAEGALGRLVQDPVLGGVVDAGSLQLRVGPFACRRLEALPLRPGEEGASPPDAVPFTLACTEPPLGSGGPHAVTLTAPGTPAVATMLEGGGGTVLVASFSPPVVRAGEPSIADYQRGNLSFVLRGEGFGGSPEELAGIWIGGTECAVTTWVSASEVRCDAVEGSSFEDSTVQVRLRGTVGAPLPPDVSALESDRTDGVILLLPPPVAVGASVVGAMLGAGVGPAVGPGVGPAVGPLVAGTAVMALAVVVATVGAPVMQAGEARP